MTPFFSKYLRNSSFLLSGACRRRRAVTCRAVPCRDVWMWGRVCERAVMPTNSHCWTQLDRLRSRSARMHSSRPLQPLFNKPPSHPFFMPQQLPHINPSPSPPPQPHSTKPHSTTHTHTSTYRVAHRGRSICDVMRRPCAASVLAQVMLAQTAALASTSLCCCCGRLSGVRSEASFAPTPACLC